ncbi:hypothetical protein CC2G_004660 [Coprinopsis cinerea AmutBmut pab1-1]|nr:hypothetical protein CC2G_004660 [Coprinopsis cinerea AmutBmut pab1-1]
MMKNSSHRILGSRVPSVYCPRGALCVVSAVGNSDVDDIRLDGWIVLMPDYPFLQPNSGWAGQTLDIARIATEVTPALNGSWISYSPSNLIVDVLRFSRTSFQSHEFPVDVFTFLTGCGRTEQNTVHPSARVRIRIRRRTADFNL